MYLNDKTKWFANTVYSVYSKCKVNSLQRIQNIHLIPLMIWIIIKRYNSIIRTKFEIVFT